MRILGVDPGTQTMGYSILDLDLDVDGGTRCLAWGTFDGGRSKEIAERLHLLLGELQALAERWSPDQLAIEEPFVAAARGAKSAVAVGQAQAVALLVAARAGIPIHRYSPATVKSAVANYGAGDKAQVQRSVRILLGLGDEPMAEDASDAIAIALCHAQTFRTAERMRAR
ncbi:MAG: crossover junction endodeoxyribonuclease RuvC [Chloroflexi bacterium]|nr:crossover junction endodeoxyribonuclease RuvC [Chloroflexota bacterium]